LGLDDYVAGLDVDSIYSRIKRTWRFELAMTSDFSSVGKDAGVEFGVAMEKGVIELDGEGLDLTKYQEASFPLERKHFRSWHKKDGAKYRALGSAGSFEFHNLRLSNAPKDDKEPSDSGGGKGCPRTYFSRPKEPEPPDKLELLASFVDPVKAVVGGSPAVPLLVSALKGFHDKEYFRAGLPDAVVKDYFDFNEKWAFTWRELVARADYSPPPKTGPDTTITEVTTLTLTHAPKPLRKSDQEVPPE
jgi:hypothetical protein